MEKLSCKTSPLVSYQILGLFGTTLTADNLYSRQGWEKLTQQFQTLLSPKRRKFPFIFIGFAESTRNFAHFENKDQLHSLNNFEVIDRGNCGYFNAPKLLF